jgi:5-methylcytosine-specific restriction enzyme A
MAVQHDEVKDLRLRGLIGSEFRAKDLAGLVNDKHINETLANHSSCLCGEKIGEHAVVTSDSCRFAKVDRGLYSLPEESLKVCRIHNAPSIMHKNYWVAQNGFRVYSGKIEEIREKDDSKRSNRKGESNYNPNAYQRIEMKLAKGNIYKRTGLHDHFGGQRQNGISTPSQSDVILIFSGASGESFGYQDGWIDKNTFQYTGEGQKGDMVFTKGNKAIRDHAINNKRLLLFFTAHSAHVTYEGEMICVDYEYFLTPDVDGKTRKGIRFTLVGANVNARSIGISIDKRAKNKYKKPNKTERLGLVTSRVGQGYYRQELLNKYNRRCAVTDSDLTEILIASHIVPWRQSNEDEKLDIENGILLSPNYDALFDKYLISFSESGNIIISRLLNSEQLVHLGINTSASIPVTDNMKKYLARHRENLR